MPFTEVGAWDFAADCFESITRVKIQLIEKLKNPPIPGYYMLLESQMDERRIYVKIGYNAKTNFVFGISFHYSNEEYRQ